MFLSDLKDYEYLGFFKTRLAKALCTLVEVPC